MRKFTFFIFILLATAAVAQPKQEYSEELEKRHGFKNIRLATPIDSIEGAEFQKDFLEKNEFESKLYSIKKPFLGSVGEIKVKSIDIKTYKGLIYEITVETERDPRLMQGMEKAYGQSVYSVRSKGYHWRAHSLSLTAFGDKNAHRLVYVSYTVHKQMKADKGKKVDDIADDF